MQRKQSAAAAAAAAVFQAAVITNILLRQSGYKNLDNLPPLCCGWIPRDLAKACGGLPSVRADRYGKIRGNGCYGCAAVQGRARVDERSDNNNNRIWRALHAHDVQ